MKNDNVSNQEELEKLMSKGSKVTESGDGAKKEKPFDKMNNIIAHVLSNLTWFFFFLLLFLKENVFAKYSSMRFEGILNVDLNEITMNLVPYPDLHFLISSLAPLYSLVDSRL